MRSRSRDKTIFREPRCRKSYSRARDGNSLSRRLLSVDVETRRSRRAKRVFSLRVAFRFHRQRPAAIAKNEFTMTAFALEEGGTVIGLARGRSYRDAIEFSPGVL